MKILAVSLLRLGDIIMLAPALNDIKRRHPDCELHLLINRQFSSVELLLSSVDKYIYFDRDGLQASMKDARRSLYEPYDMLSDLIDDLNAESYSCVYNFTHNRLSAWLCSLIRTEYIQGLTYNESGRPQFGSAWFRELNLQADSEAQSPFHLTDVFRNAISADARGPAEWGIRESAEGILESAQVFPGEKNILAIQPLTSDGKKNWGLEKFCEVVKLSHARSPEMPIAILCSPLEKAQVTAAFAPLLSDRIRIADLSLTGLVSLLKRCNALVSGDTSVKHLAAAKNVRTLEIVLGSSDHRLTGVYHHGSVIIRSLEACAPCVHSKPCHRSAHFCSQSIPVEAVVMLASEVYQGQTLQLSTVAAEYSDQIQILRVDLRTTGMWYAIAIGEMFSEAAVASMMDRFVRRLLLRHKDDKKPDLSIGSEVLLLLQLLRSSFPATENNDWKFLFAEFERQVRQIEGRLHSLKLGIKLLASHFEDQKRVLEYVRSLSAFRQQMQTLPFLRSMHGLLESVIEDDISLPFIRVRKFADTIAQVERQCLVSLKVARILESELNHSVIGERTHES